MTYGILIMRVGDTPIDVSLWHLIILGLAAASGSKS
jgi:hypothetical protein